MFLLANKNAHLRDSNIHFDAGPHTYTINNDTNKKYTSVTTWNHQHFSKFDADAIISKMQKSIKNPSNKYYGQTPEQIKAGWDKNRDEAAEAGTKMHYNIECYYNASQADADCNANPNGEEASANFTTPELSYFQNFLKYFKEKFPHHKPYRTEWMIYHEELCLAGSIDMVFENELDGSLFIYDWKRAKEITKTSAFNNFALTECINSLPDTNYWHYALQLNTYKAILEQKYEKKVTDLVLVVLHPENKNKNFQIINLPILTKEINDLFAMRVCEASISEASISEASISEASICEASISKANSI